MWAEQYSEHLATAFYMIGGGIAMGLAMQVTTPMWVKLVSAFLTMIGVLAARINPLFINFGYHMAIGILAMGIAAKIGGIYLGFTLAFALFLELLLLLSMEYLLL